MTGYTDAQIRDSIVALLAASGSITPTVPSTRIYNGRLVPLTDDLDVPAIRVYLHQSGFDWAGDALTPIFIGTVDVVVEYYCTASTDAALEIALDFDQTIQTVVFETNTWVRKWLQIERTAMQRSAGINGDRRLGMSKQIWTLKIPRSYP